MGVLSELEAIVGREHVITEVEEYTPLGAVDGYLKPRCAVRPGNAEEVRELVEWAKVKKVPLVPCSSGPPHMKGGAAPTLPGAVIVDLRRMNRIVRVDREHRVILVEPGVTYEALIPEVEKAGLLLNIPLLPRRTKSVVASVLDRDPPTMPRYQWDISDPLACLEIVFGTGDTFRTGQAAGPGSLREQWEVGGAQKAPFGPGIISWHRLIQGAQGTMGIVTWASIRCEVRPVLEEPFFVSHHEMIPLMELAYWLVRLRIASHIFLLNAVDLATICASDEEPDRLPRWNLFFVLAGGEYFPQERIRAYMEEVDGICQRLGLSPQRAAGSASAFKLLRMLKNPREDVPWKLRRKGSYYDLAFLAKWDAVRKIVSEIENIALRTGYPPNEVGVYIQPIVQGTSYYCELTFFVNLKEEQERRMAEEIEKLAFPLISSYKGYFLRPYGKLGQIVCNQYAAARKIFKELKNIFDPYNIMNPGRLFFD